MLSFPIILAIIYRADSQTLSSCSSWSSSSNYCYFYCDGSPYCVGYTINCPANWNCKVQCYNPPDDRRRNLLEYSCSGSKYGCCNSIINCPANRYCEIDCSDGCSGLTVYAQSSTSLLVKDCNNDNNSKNNCQDMNIYCPTNGRLGDTDTCELEGDSSDEIMNTNVYTEEGLRDLKITNVNTDGVTLYCGKTTTEFSCLLNTNGDACASGDTQCTNFILPTPEPTPIPSQSPTRKPTTQPTTSEPTTSEPSISPTKYPTSMPSIPPTKNPSVTPTFDPTKNPTFTFNPTKSPTISTSNPSLTPTTFEPTLNPSISPTPRPVRSGNVGGGDDDDDDDENFELDDGGTNIIKGNAKNDEWIIYLVIILSIVVVCFFCSVLYAIIAKRRKREETYGNEFRKIQSEKLFHTIPSIEMGNSNGNGGGEGKKLTVPKYKPPKKGTITMTGEHMEYNQVYCNSPMSAMTLDETEEEYSYGNDEEAVNRRLYYQAKFMQMMMEDEEQQKYLMTLNGDARKQYIEFQCNLYLQRVENMAQRKTLPMKYDNDAVSTDESVDNITNNNNEVVTAGGVDVNDESIDNINSNNNYNDYEEGDGDEDIDVAILNQINTPNVGNDEFLIGDDDNNAITNQGHITVGGINIDEIDDIDNDDDNDILNGINTKGGDLPDDIEADPLFD